MRVINPCSDVVILDEDFARFSQAALPERRADSAVVILDEDFARFSEQARARGGHLILGCNPR